MSDRILIRQAQVYPSGVNADLRLRAGRIDALQPGLTALPGETVIEADGAALLPGLHDHHIHLVSLAAALDSLHCGPPAINNAAALGAALAAENSRGEGWLRGIGYHSSLAGDIDRHWLDRYIPERPCRLQHRGGRLWVMNSAALRKLQLLEDDGERPAGLELDAGQATGRLYEADRWLRRQLGSTIPELGRASRLLASYGITGITDTTPHNGAEEWSHFDASLQRGALLQRVRMMGGDDITACRATALLEPGELKIHLLESQLPDFETLCAEIARAHRQRRAVAVHCVTLTELVFTLSAFRSAGTVPGDRIEHASVTPDEQLAEIRKLGLRVVTQPHFISERGDQYLREVEPADQPWLYRCRAFLEAGIALAAGSDASFGSADPWAAMRAAVERRTPGGVVMAAEERLTPEQALALFLTPPATPGIAPREIVPGAPGDLCLLNQPWDKAREILRAGLVRNVWRGGELIHSAR